MGLWKTTKSVSLELIYLTQIFFQFTFDFLNISYIIDPDIDFSAAIYLEPLNCLK